METASQRVGRILDDLPFQRYHTKILTLIIAGLFFDFFDVSVLGSLAPDLIATRFATQSQIAIIASATFAGLLLGSVLQGGLTDRLGRKFIYQMNLAIYGLATIASALSPDYRFLAVLRFIAGLGLGAEIPLAYSYAAEFVPRRSRGLALGLVNLFGGTLAFPVALLVSLLLRDSLGWRGIFALNGVGAMAVFFLRIALPESPRWLAARGRGSEALVVLRKMGVANLPDMLPPTADDTARVDPFVVVFTRYTRRVTAIMIAFFCAFLSTYALVTWLPSLMAGRGFTITKSLTFTLVMISAFPISSLILMFLLDRIGRIRIAVVSFLLAGIFAVAFSSSHSEATLLTTGFLMSFFVISAANALDILCGEIFPTTARSTGSGLSFGAGRLGAVFGSYAVLEAMRLYGMDGVFWMIGGILLVGAISTALLGGDPSRLSLEEAARPDRPDETLKEKVVSHRRSN
ncbi:MFS transporter [Caballeronia sp. GAWG2-1]|uniref:MFS transporter n=1 Tax=Caballeronia sp. GAWG2-1 TaxID=2921744 RepID=UPI00202873C3|nr:MFS transporter [Caballeronia sp. GAWG2-1]